MGSQRFDDAFRASHELYAAQKYVTAVYRSELATRLQGLGYQLERGEYGQPEIKGYVKEYLEASSLRREQIQDYKREQGLDGHAAAQIAAHRTRDRKELLSPRKFCNAIATLQRNTAIKRTTSLLRLLPIQRPRPISRQKNTDKPTQTRLTKQHNRP